MPNILNILKKTVFSKEPFGLLILLAIAMPIAFSTWVALLNNFVIEVAGFSGVEIGWLQSVDWQAPASRSRCLNCPRFACGPRYECCCMDCRNYGPQYHTRQCGVRQSMITWMLFPHLYTIISDSWRWFLAVWLSFAAGAGFLSEELWWSVQKRISSWLIFSRWRQIGATFLSDAMITMVTVWCSSFHADSILQPWQPQVAASLDGERVPRMRTLHDRLDERRRRMVQWLLSKMLWHIWSLAPSAGTSGRGSQLPYNYVERLRFKTGKWLHFKSGCTSEEWPKFVYGSCRWMSCDLFRRDYGCHPAMIMAPQLC